MRCQSLKLHLAVVLVVFLGKIFSAYHAKAVAAHLGTEHTEMYVTPREAMEVIPKLSDIYDEPFADSSQIPTYLLSRMTREHVTVALSGDGGDELLRGYGRYDHAHRLWQHMERMPRKMRQALGRGIQAVPAATLDAGLFWAKPVLRRFAKTGPVSQKLHKAGQGLSQSDFMRFYHFLLSKWKTPQDIVPGGVEPETLFDRIGRNGAFPDRDRCMLYLDTLTYLPDDILVKVDRAAMAVSLETRIPLLDHRVVELVWSLPNRFRWQPGFSKWALRQVLYRYVPQAIMDRAKQGFGVPVGDWIRGGDAGLGRGAPGWRAHCPAGRFHPPAGPAGLAGAPKRGIRAPSAAVGGVNGSGCGSGRDGALSTMKRTTSIRIKDMPASNLCISAYADYAEHHALRWLMDDTRPRPMFALGSDDPGVFHTSIRNEYLHLAQAGQENGYDTAAVYRRLGEVNRVGLRLGGQR